GKIAKDLAHFADGEAEFCTYDAKEGWRVRSCCEAARLPRLKAANCRQSRADRFDKVLLARCAGVHVDFHAHRHFDNLRSFPGHSGLPSIMARCSRWNERKATLDVTQVFTSTLCVAQICNDISNFGKFDNIGYASTMNQKIKG